MKHMFISLAIGSLALGLAGCSGRDTDDVNTAAGGSEAAMAGTDAGATAGAAATTAPNDHASQFLTDAMKGDNSEVRVGKLAAEKGASQGVKNFGNMLATDHGTHLTKLTGLAQSMNVPVTQDTKPEADALYAKLQGLSGAAFDKAFADGMVEDHKKDIATYQQEAASSDPAAVTGMAKDTVPTLQKHLKTAQSLQSK